VTDAGGSANDERSARVSVLVTSVGIAVVLIAVGVWLAVREVTGKQHASSSSSQGGPAAALVARSWTLTTYSGTDSLAHGAGAGARLQFLSSTQMLATDSCKSLASAVYISSSDIAFVGAPATSAGCSNASEVGVIDAVLSGDVRWTVSGSTLTLAKSGTGKLVYSGG
jgi:heat shock protein HslJ